MPSQPISYTLNMNRVRFTFPYKGLDINKTLVPPKNRTLIANWLKAARKVIPQIPDLEQHIDWYIAQEVITEKTIALQLRDGAGKECAVIIERQNVLITR